MSAIVIPATPSTLDTPAANAPCRRCQGTGWADPWEVDGGTPPLVSCHRCLGAGLDDCLDCDGDGAFAVPIVCSCE